MLVTAQSVPNARMVDRVSRPRRCVALVEVARFDVRRVGRGDGAAERIVRIGLGFREVARRDRAREDAVLGIVGRGDRRVRADAARTSPQSCRRGTTPPSGSSASHR